MGVFKPTYQTPVPKHAKRFVKDGIKYARFRQHGGRVVEDPIMPNGRCTIENSTFYARVRKPDGSVDRVNLGVSDELAAQQLAIRLQQQTDRGAAGLIDKYAEHRKRSLVGSHKVRPDRKHTRNRAGRITESASEKRQRDFEVAIEGSHLADYGLHLAAKANTDRHNWERLRKIHAVCVACGFHASDDFLVSKLERYLVDLVKSGSSYRKRNYALDSLRAFLNWMVGEAEQRIERNPFAGIKKLNEKADPRRRKRRGLAPGDARKLLRAAADGPEIQGLSGRARATLYLMAMSTGLRRKELSTLTPAHLALDTDKPSVPMDPCNAKNRTDELPIPLHPVVADALRAWVAEEEIADDQLLFPLRLPSGFYRKTSVMMRRDCKAAGIPYNNLDGVADFHGHRIAFISELSRVADFPTVVKLARHSDPRLTAIIYNRVRQEDKEKAIGALPLSAD